MFLLRLVCGAGWLPLASHDYERPVNVNNETLRRLMDNADTVTAVGRIEGWRALGDNGTRNHHHLA